MLHDPNHRLRDVLALRAFVYLSVSQYLQFVYARAHTGAIFLTTPLLHEISPSRLGLHALWLLFCQL